MTTAQLDNPPQDLPNPEPGNVRQWRGILTLVNEWTSDGRRFEAVTWRDLPLPLLWQESNSQGHDGAVVVGRIDTIVKDGNEIWGAGILDLGSIAGREVVRQLEMRMLRGVSIDAALADGEVSVDDQGRMTATLVEIGAATIVAFPAFAGAEIELITADQDETTPEAAHLSPQTAFKASGSTSLPLADKGRAWDGAAAKARVKSWAGGVNERYGQAFFIVDGPADQAGSYHLGFADVIDGKLTAIPRGVIAAAGAVQGARGASNPAFQAAKPRIAAYYRKMDMDPPWADSDSSALVASLTLPPAWWFDDPQLEQRTGLHVEADGRIYGHLYGWGECHTGSPAGQCIQVPRGDDFSYIVGTDGRGVLAANGELIQTGPLVLNADHAPVSGVNWIQAKDHYANTGLAVADVRCGEDAHGIWIAGAIRPGTPEEFVYTLRASGPSGDWRRIGGQLHLVAILAVNTQGYPALVASMSDGSVDALVVRSTFHEDGACGCGGGDAGVAQVLERLANLEDFLYAPLRQQQATARAEWVAGMLDELDNSNAAAAARLLADLAG